jgi:outer membrane protein OmpA-like peptidoglycan-associated protein
MHRSKLLLVAPAVMASLTGCQAQVAFRSPGESATSAAPTTNGTPRTAQASGLAAEVRIVFDEATQELRYRADGSRATSEGATTPERTDAPSFGAFPIFFELDKDRLRSDATTVQTLEALRTFLIAHPQTNLRIEGHTDSRAGEAYNRELSSRRAVTVMNWLADHGVDGERLEAIGHGESKPRLKRDGGDALGVEPALHQACSRAHVPDSKLCEEQVWSRNRRVEFHVTKGAEQLAADVASTSAAPSSPTEVEPTARREPCRLALGPRIALLGPNTFGTVGLTVQPGVCWLDVVGTGGVMFNTIDDAFNNLAIPLLARGRFWLGGRHAFVPELGVGATLYRQTGGAGSAYERAGTVVTSHLGIGYGFRSSMTGGIRFGVSGGVVAQLGSLPSGNAPELDAQTDSLLPAPALRFTNGVELAPYGELSLGYLFDLVEP